MSTETKETEPAKPALQAGGNISGIVPQTLDEAWRLTDAFMHAGMVPASYEDSSAEKTRAKLMMGIMQGMELGIPPLTAIKNIAIINNRPTVWGDLAVALVQDSGALAKIEVVWDDPPEGEMTEWPNDFGVTIRLYRKGQEGHYEGRFTVGDARRAQLWLNPRRQPWMKYPRRMLHWRAMGFAIRDGFADCLAGMQIREEVEDIPAPAPDRRPDTGFLEDDPTPRPALEAPAAETPEPDTGDEDGPAADTAETVEMSEEPAGDSPAPVGAEAVLETPADEARRNAERARRKLGECATRQDIDAAFRLYADGAIEQLTEAGLPDEADQLREAFADALAEMQAA